MSKVTIDRELLERLETWVTDDCEALRELQAILAAPRQPEGEGLTRYTICIVGGITAFVSAADGCMVLYEDAQHAIAERDATIERLEAGIPRLQEQSHQMRQQRDKLAGLLLEANWSMYAAPSCQSGLVERCCCRKCVHSRIDAALVEVKS